MRLTLLLIFAVSGFSALVYESVWSHYLRILVGSAAYAQSLVLAVFMGGMALGAWAVGRRSRRWPNLLRAYAVVEGALGLVGLLFHPVFVKTEGLLFGAGAALAAPGPVGEGVRWGVATLLILPQSVLVGMTFPLMAGGFIRRFPARPGATLAVLYFVNALGGAVGVLAAGFVLIRSVGLPGTVVFAGALNLVLAALVWRSSGRGSEPLPEVAEPGSRMSLRGQRVRRALVAVAALTGLAAFTYEIVWIRMLSLVLSSSAHAFELMVSAFILGLALGGLAVRWKIDRLREPLFSLALVQVGMGTLAVATLPVYLRLFPAMQGLLRSLPPTAGGYLRFNLASHAMAMAVMLPATVFAGMTLPLVTHALLREGGGEGSIGRVYGANTVGAVAGALLTVHLGLPVLGLEVSLVTGAIVNLALGSYILWSRFTPHRPGARLGAAVCAAVTAVVALTVSPDPAILASGVYRRHVDLSEVSRARVLEHEDGKSASVSLVLEPSGVLSIRSNGKPSSSVAAAGDSGANAPTGDETVSTLLGAFPLLFRPDARSAVNVGMGAGLTTHVLLASERLESVTTVEIEPAMVRLADAFRPRNRRTFEDPRSRVVTQDARAFFAASAETYDIVVTQPANPWIAGSGSLYSKEFYGLLARRMSPDGVLVQWIQLFETEPSLVASALKALSQHFPELRIYAGATGDLLVVASPRAPLGDLDQEMLRKPRLARDLAAVDVRTVQDVQMRTAGDRRTLSAFLDLYDVPPNSEYRPYVEQRAARARFMEEGAEEALRLMVQPIPVMEILDVLRPRWSESDVTPAPAFFYSARAVAAVAFRDLVVVDREPSREGTPFQRRARDDALRLQHDCAYQGFGDDALPAFYGVATSIVTDLRPHELDAVWENLKEWSCVRDLEGVERRWVDFFRAVGRRDLASIDALVPELLGLPEVLTPARSRYLVATGMLARIALGRPDGASELWTRYEDGLFDDGEPSFLFRHLVQLARSRPEGPVDP